MYNFFRGCKRNQFFIFLFLSQYFHISFDRKSIPKISVFTDNSSKFSARVSSNE